MKRKPNRATASAFGKLERARRLAATALREIFAARTEPCDAGCSGWFLDEETGKIQRCDECADYNGYRDTVCDDDIAELPEARAAVRRWNRAAARRTLALGNAIDHDHNITEH